MRVGDGRVTVDIRNVKVVAGAGKDLCPEIGRLPHVGGRRSVDDRNRDTVSIGRTGTKKCDPRGGSKGPWVQAHGRDIQIKDKLEAAVDVNGQMVSHVDRGRTNDDGASATNGERYHRNTGTSFKGERRIGTDVDRERGGKVRPVNPKQGCRGIGLKDKSRGIGALEHGCQFRVGPGRMAIDWGDRDGGWGGWWRGWLGGGWGRSKGRGRGP